MEHQCVRIIQNILCQDGLEPIDLDAAAYLATLEQRSSEVTQLDTQGKDQTKNRSVRPRQYFPKGTDMSRLTKADLDKAAHSLNGRPRQTLDWKTPSQKLAETLQ